MIASRTGAIALAAIAVGSAAGAVIQLALRAPAQHEVTVATSTVTFTASHPPVFGHATRRDCTRPVYMIGLVGGEYVSPRSPGNLRGVAASATGCTLAIWSDEGVFVSRDDGASWNHVLAMAVNAHAVAIDAAATVYVLASDRDLALAHLDGTTEVRRLPFAAEKIAAGRGWVVVVSPRELALSHDEGATWQRRPMPLSRFTSTAIFVDPAGALRLVTGGETPDDPIALWHGDERGWQRLWASPAHEPVRDSYYPDGRDGQTASINAYAFAHDGTLVAEVYDRRGHRIFVVDGEGVATVVDKIPAALDFTGTPITGTSSDFGSRDAHGKPLVLWRQRGPVRLDDHTDSFLLLGSFYGRWITGDLAPS